MGQEQDVRPAPRFVPDPDRYLTALPGLAAVPEIVVMAPTEALPAVNALADRLPVSTLHLLAFRPFDGASMPEPALNVRYVHRQGDHARADYLAGVEQPGAVLDLGDRADRALTRLRFLFTFLTEDGRHLLHCAPGTAEELAAVAALGAEEDDGTFPAELRTACARVELDGDLAVVTKRLAHRIGLRDHRANGVLLARYGTSWGEVLSTRPATSFRPLVRTQEYGRRADWHGQKRKMRPTADRMDVPELSFRRYDGVVCRHGQRVARDNYWLPDTFRHPYDAVLNHRNLVRSTNQWTLRSRDPGPETPTRRLAGAYVYLDDAYPGHFGHVTSEVVSRHWAWREAVAVDPEVRPLVSSCAPDEPMPAFQQRLFDVLGIPVDRVEFLHPDEAVEVETLYAASPMFSMSAYASLELREPWELVGRALYRGDVSTPKRLFLGRRMKERRTCLDTDEVERLVTSLGFEVVYPEDHDLAFQVTAVRNAEVVAGFAGSNLFTTMFATDVNLVVLTGDSYNANNEFLIAAVNGGTARWVIGPSEVRHPPGGWTWDAYFANFRIDLRLVEAALTDALAEALAAPRRR